MISQKNSINTVSGGLEEVGRENGFSVESKVTPPSTEVVARTTRRKMTTAYKLKVLDTVATLREQGEGAIGAYLRSEGLYYSNIHKWEQQRREGKLTSTNRGPKERSVDSLKAEIKHLRRKLEQTEKRLKKSEMIVELQKKLSALMEIETPQRSEESDGK